jgi:type IV pilus assembly protein PilY1
MLIRHFFARRLPQASVAMLLTLLGGFSAPVPVQASISVIAAVAVGSTLFSEPASAATATVAGTVEISPGPPNLTQAAPPNIMLTFDDSGSMASNFLSDNPPFSTKNDGTLLASGYDWSQGPWRCAGLVDADALDGASSPLDALVMNGVYYNPNITYKPPVDSHGNSFPAADPTLNAVWVDGVTVNRPRSPAAADASTGFYNNPQLDSPRAGAVANLMGLNSTSVVTFIQFGSSCGSGADSGSCQTFTSASSTSRGTTTFSYFVWGNGITTTGSGTPPQSGTNLSYGTTCAPTNNCTQETSTSNSSKKYSVWTKTTTTDNRWKCGSAGAGATTSESWTSTSPIPNGGPYYYRLKKGVAVNLTNGKPATTSGTTSDLKTLYTASNWEAVSVPASQYPNFANWYAYYRTRNQMARSGLSLVFGSLGTNTANSGYGSTMRAAWQNLNDSGYQLPGTAIIASLIDTSACTSISGADPSALQREGSTLATPPPCYRSAFFNWIFQTPANNSTPTRSAMMRAGFFFERGGPLDAAQATNFKTLLDPYWEAGAVDPTTKKQAVGNELYCRQNFHMLVTDGLWNGDGNGDNGVARTSLTTLAPTSGAITLPDQTVMPSTSAAGVSSIYSPVVDANNTSNTSLSDVAFNFWATDLRSDLYIPGSQQFVTPYMPDTTTGVVSTTTPSGALVATANVNDEVYFNPSNDPASWPHMSEYLVGLGVSGQLNYSTDTDCAVSASSDACLLRKGATNSSGAVGWPTPNGAGGGIAANIDDTWHAALAGRGQFFSAGNPSDLVTQLTKILSNIASRNVPASTGAISAAVLTTGTLAFSAGYNSADWSGLLQAFFVNLDGTLQTPFQWDAAAQLTAMDPTKRVILSATFDNTTGKFAGGLEFKTFSNLDTAGQALLMTPPSTNATLDIGQTRVDWLRGIKTSETNGTMRQRTNLLGAIIRAQPVYVAYPASGYRNTWPALANGDPAPETVATTSPSTVAGSANVSYEQFTSNQINRKPVVYVAANDGMLHAFDASQNADGSKVTGASGNELWAYVPRSAYTNLGNLTLKNGFTFAPTVDATPITRDVFFDTDLSSPAATTQGWHTILVGGLGQGGRGVYALDITSPDPADPTGNGVSAANAGSKVLWEFSAGMPAVAAGNPADLGYTYGQPNIGRLANGKWVVLVPGGYFPDCSQGDHPTNCTANNTSPAGGSPAVNYSSLFILDAQTGTLISELKTPTTTTGVTSYGLSSPVLGDYNNDQIDDVAFAGDLAGNLWRYDLTNPDPTQWTVTLAYQPDTQGQQPITSMPRLFPDPVTNRFIVVFGTGKYLGAGDNTTTGPVQAVYGIRDTGTTVAGTSNLVAQTLSEQAGTGANAGNEIIGITSNPVPVSNNGWYFNLIANGERVVVTPGALFDTNRAVITTLIPNNNTGCAANNNGSLIVIDATTGGAGDGLGLGPSTWSSGGATFTAVGGIVTNPPTGGTVPVATAVGGGKLLFPGMSLTGGGTLTGDDAIWRRRSWRELNNGQ